METSEIPEPKCGVFRRSDDELLIRMTSDVCQFLIVTWTVRIRTEFLEGEYTDRILERNRDRRAKKYMRFANVRFKAPDRLSLKIHRDASYQ